MQFGEFSVVLWLFLVGKSAVSDVAPPPNIIFILADDLGWNDVGFHGSAQIPTPNIDALAYSGLILHNYYVTPICTPSRSALMTGKYPIHTGMQHTVLFGMETRGLPLTEKILPQHLKTLGYSNHIVGKWHLGHYKKEYTPLFRGFDSHLGYWTGHQDYFDHTAMETGTWGLDMRRNLTVAYDLHGKYTTDVISNESEKIILAHNTSKPLFLYVAHAGVHSGNPYNPLPAPDETVAKFENIRDYNRRRFTAMVSKVDDSVGVLVKALESKSMLENSIIIFSTDNGGPAEGFNSNAASNWPLKGVKNTLWEGGLRGVGCVFSPLFKKPQRVASQLFHISDWLPTLYAAAGGDVKNLGQMDGINQWTELSEDKPSTRQEILHNIDHIYGDASLLVYPWKVVNGTTYQGEWDGWYGPAGERSPESYNTDDVRNSDAGSILDKHKYLPGAVDIKDLRNKADIICNDQLLIEDICNALVEPCLFNMKRDPCELSNVAKKYPEILKNMMNTLWKYDETAIPPSNTALDIAGDPKNTNYVWANFGDF